MNTSMNQRARQSLFKDETGRAARMALKTRYPIEKDLRLGPDILRRQRLSRIRKTVDAAPVDEPAPFVFPKQDPPETPSIAVGDAIVLADKIRIFEQYARVVSQACLGNGGNGGGFLSGEQLPAQLEWFEPLRQAVQSPTRLHPTFARQLGLFRGGTASGIVSAPGTADEYYAMQQAVPYVDLELVRHMLSLARPGSLRYEAHVSSHILRLHRDLPFADHMLRLENWRDAGLLHPILLAVSYMPTLNDWLPVELHREAAGWGEIIAELNAASGPDEIEEALRGLDTRVDWSGPAGLAIAGILDRLAVGMRVLSNSPPGGPGLDEALRGFPDWSGARLAAVWKGARAALETRLPPCVLCPRMADFRRATWGYKMLTPTYDGKGVRFAERELEWVEPFEDKQRAGDAPEDGRTAGKKDPGRQAGARIQDVLCRMGEIALSPEMGHLMMLALEGLDFIRQGQSKITEHELGFCCSPPLLLHFMSKADIFASDDEDVQELVDALFGRLPAVACVRRPTRIVGWRVDPPARVVLYTGRHPGRSLSTALLDERSDVSSVGRIFALPVAAEGEHDARQALSRSLLGCLRSCLRQPIVETVRVDNNRPHTHTALHEGLAEMALQESLLHTNVPLHSCVRWNNEREDARYSEAQVGSNGKRLRDWFAVHRDPVEPQKCRMDSHAVLVDKLYCTLFPWRREDGATAWVDVAASVPPEVRVLQSRPHAGSDNKDPLGALLASVKGRFLQDLKLLPVRDRSHRIDRANTSVYADRRAGQILICYAPTGDPESRIEFMAFGLRA